MQIRKHAILVFSLIALAQAAHAQSYKCKSAGGRIEYSDIPCATDKDELSKPKSGGVVSRPAVAPMQQLDALFKEYESRLCEREKLATEVDLARRDGEIAKNADAWKSKQDRLGNMNETLIEFQGKAGKITRAAGNDSPESTAMRKFQSKLKDCAKTTTN